MIAHGIRGSLITMASGAVDSAPAGPVLLQRLEGRGGPAHQDARLGAGPARDPRQRGGSRLGPHPHDRPARRGAAGADWSRRCAGSPRWAGSANPRTSPTPCCTSPRTPRRSRRARSSVRTAASRCPGSAGRARPAPSRHMHRQQAQPPAARDHRALHEPRLAGHEHAAAAPAHHHSAATTSAGIQRTATAMDRLLGPTLDRRVTRREGAPVRAPARSDVAAAPHRVRPRPAAVHPCAAAHGRVPRFRRSPPGTSSVLLQVGGEADEDVLGDRVRVRRSPRCARASGRSPRPARPPGPSRPRCP